MQAVARSKNPDQKPQADKKPETPKLSGVPEKKSKEGEKKKSSVRSKKSKTPKKRGEEPVEDKVTDCMRQARMKKSQYIKCGSKDHISKDCTAEWKATAEEKSKRKGNNKVDNNKVAVVQAANDLISLVISSVSFGHIISEDELDYQCEQGQRLSCTSGQTVSWDWFNICVVKKSISVSDWKEEYEGEVMDIDPVSISSCVQNLSPSSCLSLIQMTKTAKK